MVLKKRKEINLANHSYLVSPHKSTSIAESSWASWSPPHCRCAIFTHTTVLTAAQSVNKTGREAILRGTFGAVEAQTASGEASSKTYISMQKNNVTNDKQIPISFLYPDGDKAPNKLQLDLIWSNGRKNIDLAFEGNCELTRPNRKARNHPAAIYRAGWWWRRRVYLNQPGTSSHVLLTASAADVIGFEPSTHFIRSNRHVRELSAARHVVRPQLE
nr:hypothetical protein Iba_chr14eCG0660 [Ipomoea batatas]